MFMCIVYIHAHLCKVFIFAAVVVKLLHLDNMQVHKTAARL